MNALLEIMAANAVLAGIMALAAFCVTRVVRKPTVVYWLWALVLLKLVTPPLVPVPLAVEVAWIRPPEVVTGTSQTDRLVSDEPTATLLGEPTLTGPVESTVPHTQSGRGYFPEEGVADAAVSERDLAAQDVSRDVEFASIAASQSVSADLGAADVAANPALEFDAPAASPLHPRRPEWTAVLTWTWMLGAGLWFALAAVRLVRFRRFLKRAQPAAEWLQEEAAQLARRFGLRGCPKVVAVPGSVPPLLWTFGRSSVIAVPASLFAKLAPAEQVLVVAHELAHLRRRDHWFRWAEAVILGLHWWNPIAWWARRQLGQAEEQCCDAWVLWAFPEKAKSYAHVLLSAMEFLSRSRTALPAGASGFGRVNEVKRRLEMILANNISRRSSWPARVGLMVFGCVVLGFSARVMHGEGERAVGEEAVATSNAAVEQSQGSAVEVRSDAESAQTARKPGAADRVDAMFALIQELKTHRATYEEAAKKQKEAVAELNKLGVHVWSYEPNELGKLNEELNYPLGNLLGDDLFHSVAGVSIREQRNEKELEAVLERLKSLPELRHVDFPGWANDAVVKKFKENLRGVDVQNANDYGRFESMGGGPAINIRRSPGSDFRVNAEEQPRSSGDDVKERIERLEETVRRLEHELRGRESDATSRASGSIRFNRQRSGKSGEATFRFVIPGQAECFDETNGPSTPLKVLSSPLVEFSNSTAGRRKYSLRMAGFPGHEETEVYARFTAWPVTSTVMSYLERNQVNIEITAKDLAKALADDSITKIYYFSPEAAWDGPDGDGVRTLLIEGGQKAEADLYATLAPRGNLLAVLELGTVAVTYVGGKQAMTNPPRWEEVLGALPKSSGAQSKTTRRAVRISLEKISERMDDGSRYYPLVGLAQLHRAHYKCTVKFDVQRTSEWPVPSSQREQTQTVVYIDKQELVAPKPEKKTAD